MPRPLVTDQTTMTLETSRRHVEDYLADYFSNRLLRASGMDEAYGRLWETVFTLYQVGGKRLRPFLTLLSYQAYAQAEDVRQIVPAAAAQELLHLAMLVHDDVIDRDDVRYGIANVSGQYDSLYADALPEPAERAHFVDSAALLAGDALLSDSYKLIAECKADPAVILRAQALLNDAVFTVIGGELLDTESAFNDKAHVKPIDIATYKTASYSFISPLLMGATFAGADPIELDCLRSMGQSLGVAYQLQDDLLGMFGESMVTGKSTTSDLGEGKYTELVRVFYERADDEQRAAFDMLFGHGELPLESHMGAHELLITTGAKSHIEQQVLELSNDAKLTIDRLGVDDNHKDALRNLVNNLTTRER